MSPLPEAIIALLTPFAPLFMKPAAILNVDSRERRANLKADLSGSRSSDEQTRLTRTAGCLALNSGANAFTRG